MNWLPWGGGGGGGGGGQVRIRWFLELFYILLFNRFLRLDSSS